MKPLITAFKDSPDDGQGMARDMRIRWALEEVNQPYDVQLLTFQDLETPEYLAMQPFGEIPTYRTGDLVLFETGAILLHISDTYPGLLPTEPHHRLQSISWMFAALNSVEPPIVALEVANLLERDSPWYADRLPFLQHRVRVVLKDLARHLESSEWVNKIFTSSDILLVTVLRRLEGTGMLEEFPSLVSYIERGKARPAYKRAFDAQYHVFQNRE